MDKKTITQQRERLRLIICPHEPDLTVTQIIYFGRKAVINSEMIINMIEVCEKIAVLSFHTAIAITEYVSELTNKRLLKGKAKSGQLPEITVEWLLQGEPNPNNELQKQLSGAWRLNHIDPVDGWYSVKVKDWGPMDIQFADGTININKLIRQETHPCTFLPAYKRIAFNGVYYRISELTDNQLSIRSESSFIQYDFIRISESEIRESTLKVEIPIANLKGRWIIEEEQEQISDGVWAQVQSFYRPVGLWIWDIDSSAYERRFTHIPREGGIIYDPTSQILRAHFANPALFFQIIADGEKSFWGYILQNEVGDYRRSTKRLHFVRWDENEDRGKLHECLYFIEKNATYQKAADKIPVEYLRLWHSENSQAIAKLISDYSLINNPAQYQSDDYIGAYIFLHNYLLRKPAVMNKLNSALDAPIDITTAYLQFNEIIGLWLSLYERGETVKNIYLFNTIKYTDFLAMLHEKTEQI